MNGVLQIAVIIAEGVHLVLGVFGVAIYRIYKGGDLFSSILLCWGLCILLGVIWCIVLPVVLLPFGKEVVLLFPEAIGAPALVFAGWIPCVLVCAIASGVITVVKRREKSETIGQAGRAPS